MIAVWRLAGVLSAVSRPDAVNFADDEATGIQRQASDRHALLLHYNPSPHASSFLAAALCQEIALLDARRLAGAAP